MASVLDIVGNAPVYSGVDFSSGPDTTALIVYSGRTGGKTVAMEKYIAEYLKKHPDTVICRYIDDQLIIEKPVKGWHE